MKKSYVFVLGSYYPLYSAVGVCLKGIAEKLSLSNDVFVICEKNAYGQKPYQKYKNQTIIRVESKDKKILNTLNHGNVNFIKIKKIIIRAKNYLKAIFKKKNLNETNVALYYDAICKIDKIDYLIPLCLPMEGVVAAVKYKKEKNNMIKLIPYLFDPFSDNVALHRLKINKKIKYKRHLEIEREMVETADHILAMEHLRLHFQREFKNDLKKLIFLEHPLFEKRKVKKILKTSSDVSCIYAGSLIKKIRNPQYFLKLFCEVCKRKDNIKIDMYIAGNCNGLVKKYFKKQKEQVSIHDFLPQNELQEKIEAANMIIIIGNSNLNQSPSKVIESISIGKPIVYFYKNKMDTALKILKDYPASLCIYESDDFLEKNIDQFIDFVEKYKNYYVNIKDIFQKYLQFTPEYTINIFNDL